jgi:hypothetical protein
MATEKPRRRSDVVVRSGRLDAVEAVPFDHAELRRLGRKLAGAAELHREALEGPQGRIFFLRASDRSALRGCRIACRVRLFPQDVSARRTRGAVSREESVRSVESGYLARRAQAAKSRDICSMSMRPVRYHSPAQFTAPSSRRRTESGEMFGSIRPAPWISSTRSRHSRS